MRVSFLIVLVLAGFAGAQDTNFQAGPQYLVTTSNAQFLRPIVTPSMSLNTPLPAFPSLPQVGPTVTAQPYISNPTLEHQPDLYPIYYGYPEIPVIELSGEPPRELPASINDTGFLPITTARSLRELGYGVTVVQDAGYWKTHKRPIVRLYTNADIRH